MEVSLGNTFNTFYISRRIFCVTEYNEVVISVLLVSRSEIFQDIQVLISHGGESFNFFLFSFSDILEISYDLLSQITSAQFLIFFSQ